LYPYSRVWLFSPLGTISECSPCALHSSCPSFLKPLIPHALHSSCPSFLMVVTIHTYTCLPLPPRAPYTIQLSFSLHSARPCLILTHPHNSVLVGLRRSSSEFHRNSCSLVYAYATLVYASSSFILCPFGRAQHALSFFMLSM
jgi:hypothetical protein